ncbi:MAG: transporter substrate-binding domain-containing protein [Propionibacteriaceae bacterium]|nr:transporter substrate-binding domain-containing protein [Propionibacteriaceae bacterium]
MPPSSNPARLIRLLASGILTLATLLSLPACANEPGGTTTTTPPPVGNYRSGNAAFDEIINNGPVADAALIEAFPWTATLRQTGVLRVGSDGTSPLFWDVADATGFERGLALLLARYLLGNAVIEVVPVTPNTAADALATGAADVVISQYAITPERLERLRFSGPYYLAGSTMVSRSATVGAQHPTRVAVVANSVQATLLPATSEALPLPTHAQCVAALLAGDADAYLADESLAIAAWAANPEFNLGPRLPAPTDAYGIAFPRSAATASVKLLFDNWLAGLMADGTWAALWQLTLGQAGGEAPLPPVLNSAGNA